MNDPHSQQDTSNHQIDHDISKGIHQDVGPAELADIVGGTWEVEADPSWKLKNIQRMRNVGKFPTRGEIKPGTVAYASNPVKFLKRFENVVQGSKEVVLLVDGAGPKVPVSCAVLRVHDVIEAANEIARSHRETFLRPVVAVTGSMGKTTVTSMLNATLSQGNRVFSPRSDLNGIASIRSRALALKDEDFAVLEVPRAVLPGAEQILRPDIAVITAIAEAHMEAFGSLENTARAKASLLSGLTSEGTALINVDAPHSDILLNAAHEHARHLLTYGVRNDADIALINYDPGNRMVTARVHDSTYKYEIEASGRHNAVNSLAVLGVLQALGLNIHDYLQGISQFQPVQGRGEITEVKLPSKTLTIVDQTFNANPVSMESAIADFTEQYPESNRILVLGDMLELGDQEATLHERLAPMVSKYQPKRVYLVGHLMLNMWAHLPEGLRGAHLTSPEQAMALLEHDITEDAAILLKASHGTGLSRVVHALTSLSNSR